MEYLIYKITCNSPNIDHVYVGSTENIEQRTYKHKSVSNRGTNIFKLYNTIRDNGGIDNWKLEVIESGTVETKFEIKSRERFWYDQLRANVNMIRPQASKEEIRIDGLKKAKQYKSQHKDKLKQYQLQYNERNKEKLKQYQLQNKDKVKQYNEQNKVRCETCSYECIKTNMPKHKKTQKHLKNLELNNSVSKSDL